MRAARVVVFGAAMICGAPAFAEAQSTDSGLVEVYIAAPELEAAAMEKVARELLERLHVRAHVTHVERVDAREVVTAHVSAEAAVARAWVDLAGAGPATLYVVDAPWERVLVRNVPSGSDEVVREALAHILETAVDALLHGGRIGVERDQLVVEPQPPPAPIESKEAQGEARPRSPDLLKGELQLSYEAQLFGPGGVVRQGPAASLLVRAGRGRIRPGASAGVQYRVPVLIEDAVVALRFDSVATRAFGVVDVTLTDRVTLRAGVGMGLDFDRVSPRAGTDPTARITAAESELVPVGRLTVGASVGVLEHLALDFGTAADFDFTRSRYVTLRGADTVVVFAPWAVRPALFVGLAAH